ncbi:hypothetical protein TELCIR_06441 [Teladorsagia circumcincta]|uniref:Uncharacterized protein n=1 Tax=Teladorsagia circumcincta TaxID=45464 RepID=A0A2G9UMY8_TELCI|nr:hypothetical protein TELCIR_06441 [Teladorsagia circumcincta]
MLSAEFFLACVMLTTILLRSCSAANCLQGQSELAFPKPGVMFQSISC